jgi:hypothetical protein
MDESIVLEIKNARTSHKWRGLRSTSKGLYALELEYNKLRPFCMSLLQELFMEQLDSRVAKMNHALINTTLRILVLDNNLISNEGAWHISLFLENSRSLIAISLANNNISIEGAEKIANCLIRNTHLRYLNLGSNPIKHWKS